MMHTKNLKKLAEIGKFEKHEFGEVYKFAGHMRGKRKL